MKKYLLLIMLAVFSLFSLRGNAYGFGLVNHGNERPNAGKYGDIINNNGGVYIGKDTKEIYLTFDCGYENGYTPMILDALKNTDTKAIFFITGHYLTSATDLVQRMMDEGHIIGNHTYAHKDFTKSSNESILEDIKKLENKFYETFGKKMSSYVRPPRGEFDERSLKLLQDNGYKGSGSVGPNNAIAGLFTNLAACIIKLSGVITKSTCFKISQIWSGEVTPNNEYAPLIGISP